MMRMRLAIPISLWTASHRVANVRGSGDRGSVSRQEDYIGYSTSGDDPFGVG